MLPYGFSNMIGIFFPSTNPTIEPEGIILW